MQYTEIFQQLPEKSAVRWLFSRSVNLVSEENSVCSSNVAVRRNRSYILSRPAVLQSLLSPRPSQAWRTLA